MMTLVADLIRYLVAAMADAPWWAWPTSIVTVLGTVLLIAWWVARAVRGTLTGFRLRLEARATGDQDRMRSIRQVRQQLTMDRLITVQFVIAMTFSAYGMAEVARLHAGIPVPANWLLFAVFEGFALVIMTMINQRADKGLPPGGLGAIYWAVMLLAAGFNSSHSQDLVGRAVWASITLLAACSYALRMAAKRAGREEELRAAAGRAATRRLALARWLRPVERVQVMVEMARDENVGADAATRLVRDRAEQRRGQRALDRVVTAAWRLRRVQVAPRRWGMTWWVDRRERGAETRTQRAIRLAQLATSTSAVAATLRQLQMMDMASRIAGMDYSSAAEARSAMAQLITEDSLKPVGELPAGRSALHEPDRIGASEAGSLPDHASGPLGSPPTDPPDDPVPDRTDSDRIEPVGPTGSHTIEPESDRIDSPSAPDPVWDRMLSAWGSLPAASEPDQIYGPGRIEPPHPPEPVGAPPAEDEVGPDRSEESDREPVELDGPRTGPGPDQQPAESQPGSVRSDPSRTGPNPGSRAGPHRSLAQLQTEMAEAVRSGRLDRNTADRIVDVLKVGKARARKLRDWAEAEGLFREEPAVNE